MEDGGNAADELLKFRKRVCLQNTACRPSSEEVQGQVLFSLENPQGLFERVTWHNRHYVGGGLPRDGLGTRVSVSGRMRDGVTSLITY